MPHKMFVPPPHSLDRNLALEVVRVTEASALAAALWMGRGTEKSAEDAAINAMQRALNGLSMQGVVVNGRYGQDETSLHTGEKLGTGQGPRVDIALIAIEGVTICAKGGLNALSVVAATESGSFLAVPEKVYMEKIAVGPHLPIGIVDLGNSPEENLDNVAKAKGVAVSDLTVCMLDRPRHAELLDRVYEAGARVVLIDDGDVSGAIAVGLPETGIDLYMGSGGGAEGVLAAAGLKCLGGQMQCRLLLRSEGDKAQARKAGIENVNAKWNVDDMVQGDVMFAATGITDGHLLKGVRMFPGGAVSHSVVMRSMTGTIRTLTARHDFTKHAKLHPEDK
jgi:fructose-1,6-bisphosphatase II / sedoheptulose-1,7-bisphosphatase